MNKKEENGIDEIAEDTGEIQETTSSIDKKTSWLIALWIIDKVIMAILILWLGK